MSVLFTAESQVGPLAAGWGMDAGPRREQRHQRELGRPWSLRSCKEGQASRGSWKVWCWARRVGTAGSSRPPPFVTAHHQHLEAWVLPPVTWQGPRCPVLSLSIFHLMFYASVARLP